MIIVHYSCTNADATHRVLQCLQRLAINPFSVHGGRVFCAFVHIIVIILHILVIAAQLRTIIIINIIQNVDARNYSPCPAGPAVLSRRPHPGTWPTRVLCFSAHQRDSSANCSAHWCDGGAGAASWRRPRVSTGSVSPSGGL